MVDFLSSKAKTQDTENFENFIPIACHYNKDTLLTKSGELIQTLRIDGLGAKNPPPDMRDFRKFIREILLHNLDSADLACWVHNIRSKTNIDIDGEYPYEFSKNLHQIWCKKNYLEEKYVNTIYLSFVHKKMIFGYKSLNEIVDSLYFKIVEKNHNEYLEKAHTHLNNTVNTIIEALNSKVSAKKLSLISKGEKLYSENVSFYRRIVEQEDSLVDISRRDAIYEFSHNKLKLSERYLNIVNVTNKKSSTEESGNKFVSMLAIKDYYEVSEKLLYQFLSLPTEMCVTEVFFPISPGDKITQDKKYQEYVANISKDDDFTKIIENILPKNTNSNRVSNFYSRQITIALYGHDIESLENNVKLASEKLSKIGLLHTLEDILLEHSFLAQLPGNFHYLRRISCVDCRELAAFSILHQANYGSKFNEFSKAITIFRDLRGLPYYFNFYNKQGKANFCIVGTQKSGKTFLTNFLISEASKYEHKILYLTLDEKPKLVLESMNGVWQESPLINPFLGKDAEKDLAKLKKLCLILGSAYTKSLSETQIEQLKELIEIVRLMKPQERSKENILAQMQDNDLKKSLTELITNEDYANLFSSQDATANMFENNVVAINLNSLTYDYYYKKYDDTAVMPKERERFSSNLDLNDNIKAIVVSSLLEEFFSYNHAGIKILVIDEVIKILDHTIFDEFSEIIKNFIDEGNIVISTCTTELLGKENVCKAAQSIITDVTITKAIMAGEKLPSNYSEILNISLSELDLINHIPVETRSFMLKQNDEYVLLELSLGGMPVIANILSADKELLKAYTKIKTETAGNTQDAINLIYERLKNVYQ
ncbi:MAG: hypothetical protein K9G11_00205 [Rickettsiaceae bacterium]|nr:hypothetical protein [Rickettsiaceae bacterium]